MSKPAWHGQDLTRVHRSDHTATPQQIDGYEIAHRPDRGAPIDHPVSRIKLMLPDGAGSRRRQDQRYLSAWAVSRMTAFRSAWWQQLGLAAGPDLLQQTVRRHGLDALADAMETHLDVFCAAGRSGRRRLHNAHLTLWCIDHRRIA